MDNNELEKPKQDPRSIIEAIRQEISVMGANDSEFSQLDAIINTLNSGTIDDEEAIKRAYAVRDNKQDYH